MGTPDAARPGGEEIAELDHLLAVTSDLEQRIAIIRSAIAGRIAFSTSLSIEDQAVLHAIATPKADIDVFTLDTGRHFPETLDVIAVSTARYGMPIRIAFPEAQDVEELVARDGINGFRDSIEARKACCDVRKVRPLRHQLAGASGWITGLRRDQSGGRNNTPFATWDNDFQLAKFNPIADWTLEQLETYVDDNSIPINALHAKGYPSIGCQPCTRATEAWEDIRAGRWWWENQDGKECGLHNRPANFKHSSGKTPA
ncbi:MAG: phosphoadenylyl-sulfate reductase [Hyphomicrobiaceae bacterium]